jgi:hypothetical protein
LYGTALGCLVYFVYSIVWNGNAINWAPAWCDFYTYTRAFTQFLSLTEEVYPWVSWDDTHWGYSRVFQFPRVVLNKAPVAIVGLETTRWVAVLCVFVFFGFFGFADEAMKNYRLLASTVAKRLGYGPSPSNSPQDQLPAMKFFVDEVLQTPESVLDLATVRRLSATDVPESVYPDDTLDRV